MNRATYNGVVRLYNRSDEREVARKVLMGTRDTNIPLGDGKAGVTVTRGFKSWFSSREAGLTVESTVAVSLTCGQNIAEIEDACAQAGLLAEGLASNGMSEMGFRMQNIPEDIRDGLGKQLTAGKSKKQEEEEEPPRRSDKTRHPGKRRY
jgi:hypothetical protein